MSHVDNYILVVLCDEEEGAVIAELNRMIQSSSCCGDSFFRLVDQYAGGNKAVEASIYMGAGSAPGLEELVMEAEWAYPDCVQLFKKGQHVDLFVEIDLS